MTISRPLGATMNDRSGNILVVDDDPDVLQAARLFLKQHVARIRTESNPELLPGLLKAETFDVILLDMNFTKDVTSGKEGFHWLDRILEIDPAAVVILITAFADLEMAVRAIKRGAADFVGKPWQNEKLLATVLSALALRRSHREVDNLRTRQQVLSDDMDRPYHDFIGVCDAMNDVFRTITKVATTDANVLILGENGTGKELAARALHRQSHRCNEVFVKVDMGAISETLFESELFGHVKGAFTDARADRAGRFEVAGGGTLFLDEIGNLSMPMQTKLLSALQNRQITRVGSNAAIPVDIRLVCATSLPLVEMVTQGSFRQDLLYRINTVEVHLPALRDRVADIEPLAIHFLSIYGGKYRRPDLRLSPQATAHLRKHRWPGNVRELQHAVERAVIMSESPVLSPEDFPLTTGHSGSDLLTLERYNLDDVEQAVIRKALARHDGNISHAAEELGLTRASLYRRLQKHGL